MLAVNRDLVASPLVETLMRNLPMFRAAGSAVHVNILAWFRARFLVPSRIPPMSAVP